MSGADRSHSLRSFASLLGIAIFFLAAGALLSSHSIVAAAGIAVLALFVVARVFIRKFAGVELWQVLMLAALTGDIVLNYGFANISLHVGGIPLIVGHGLMLAALALAIRRYRCRFRSALRDPAIVCFSILIILAVCRLIFDIPQFGLYGLRDASLVTEGIFLIAGFIWGMDRRAAPLLMKWLMIVFVLNTIYSYTFIIGDQLKAVSPKSGIFLEVPVLGTYAGNDCYLLAGALFCVLLGSRAVRWPRFVCLGLALAQLFGLAILQARAEYVSLFLCLALLAMLGQFWKCVELVGSVWVVITILLVLTSGLGIEISGRVGPVNLAFLRDHASSLFGERYAPAEGSIDDREDWYDQVWQKIQEDPSLLVVGYGFGRPLIDAYDSGVATRQPHNSNLTILARMGIPGLVVWLIFHYLMLVRFVRVFRKRSEISRESHMLILWFLLLYVVLMVDTSVQPGLEFSNGAIPFYTLMGFALSTMRRQLASTRAQRTTAGFARPASVQLGFANSP